jgi:predicted  nucleic acid-binding Zn-ribbon protein
MAMDEVLKKLQTLQDILSEKIGLEQDIQEIPKILITQEEILSRFKRTFVEKSLEQEKTRVAESEFRNFLIDAETHREKAEKTMDIVTTPREIEALEKEIRDAAEKEQQYRKDVQREERLLADLNEQIKQTGTLIEQQEDELAAQRSGVETEIAEKRAKLEELAVREK